jgi:hypothetical protein
MSKSTKYIIKCSEGHLNIGSVITLYDTEMDKSIQVPPKLIFDLVEKYQREQEEVGKSFSFTNPQKPTPTTNE